MSTSSSSLSSLLPDQAPSPKRPREEDESDEQKNEKKEKPMSEGSKGSWIALLPLHLKDSFAYGDFIGLIAKNDLCDDPQVVGRTGDDGVEVLVPIEDVLHVTLLPGLPPLSDELKTRLSKCGYLHIKVESAGVFKIPESKDGSKPAYDVLHLVVGPADDTKTMSPLAVQSLITKHTGVVNPYKTNTMHVTLAYLKPGRADGYLHLAAQSFGKTSFVVDRIHWSKDGDRISEPVKIELAEKVSAKLHHYISFHGYGGDKDPWSIETRRDVMFCDGPGPRNPCHKSTGHIAIPKRATFVHSGHYLCAYCSHIDETMRKALHVSDPSDSDDDEPISTSDRSDKASSSPPPPPPPPRGGGERSK